MESAKLNDIDPQAWLGSAQPRGLHRMPTAIESFAGRFPKRRSPAKSTPVDLGIIAESQFHEFDILGHLEKYRWSDPCKSDSVL
jgi:hypothetical protein